MLFPSFLALGHIDSFPCPFLISLLFFLPWVPGFSGGKRKEQMGMGGEGGLSLSLNPPGIQISLACACLSFSSHTAQHSFLIFLCSPCLPVAVSCLSFHTKPKLPGVRHHELPGKRNVGTHVDGWDADKVTAVSSI